MKKRIIDFFNIDNFMTEVERIQQMNLRNQEFVIAPLLSDTAKVWDASVKLKAEGICKGMDLAMAKRIAKNVIVIAPNPDLYNRVHQKIFYKLSKLTPLIEADKLGRFYLDFTGFDKLYGDPNSFAMRILNEVKSDFSFKPRIGISSNKLISKAATNREFVDEYLLYVKKNEITDFLNPYPSLTLPAVKDFQRKQGGDSLGLLENLNLEVVSAIKQLDIKTLDIIFPKFGKDIYSLARGVDYRPVFPPRQEPAFVEDLHLEETNDRTLLLQYLFHLADSVCYKLRQKNYNFSRFKLAIRYSDFKYYEKTIELKTFAKYSYEIYDELKRCFEFLFTRRVKIRYLLLELSRLSSIQMQLSLFEDSRKKVFDTLDTINEKFPASISLGRIPR